MRLRAGHRPEFASLTEDDLFPPTENSQRPVEDRVLLQRGRPGSWNPDFKT